MSGGQGSMRGPKALGATHRCLARNLVQLRYVQRISTTRLSEMLRERGHVIHASAITRIETGGRRVDVDDLAALAVALGVTPQRLMEEPGECETCHGEPPAGFACRECGADG